MDVFLVLGEQFAGTIDASGFDNIKKKSVWKVDTGGSGSYIYDTSGVLVVIPLSNSWVWQIKYSAEKAGVVQRFYKGSVWTNWEQISVDIPSFYKDYQNLSSLLLALSNLENGDVYDTGGLDQVVRRGLWYGGDGFVLVLNHTNYTNIAWQIMIEWQGSLGVKIRRTNNAGAEWTEWKTFSLS